MLDFDVPIFLFDLFDDTASMITLPKQCRQKKCKRLNQRSSPFLSKHLLNHRNKVKPTGNSLKLKKAAAEPQSKLTTTIERSDIFSKQFDLKDFSPAETKVKVNGNTLIIEGKHEEKSDDGTYECREYQSRISVPDNVLLEQIKCKVNEDGKLQIEAPLKTGEEKPDTPRTIPIEFVNQPVEPNEQEIVTLD